jgi:hypothetical protein
MFRDEFILADGGMSHVSGQVILDKEIELSKVLY